MSSWIWSAFFVGAYLVSVAAAMWTNTAVLCLGDPKFGGGCGGFTLYYPLWALGYAPLVAAALVIVRPKMLPRVPGLRNVLLFTYFFLIVLALEVSFINDLGFGVLLIEWIVLGMTFRFIRSWALSQAHEVAQRRHWL